MHNAFLSTDQSGSTMPPHMPARRLLRGMPTNPVGQAHLVLHGLIITAPFPVLVNVVAGVGWVWLEWKERS